MVENFYTDYNKKILQDIVWTKTGGWLGWCV